MKPPIPFLLNCWAQYESHVPYEFYHKIAAYILQGLLNIEPGCLSYLAMTDSGLETLDSPEKIIRFARKESSDRLTDWSLKGINIYYLALQYPQAI
ncbi:hypothetical protein LNO81_30415 [Klebsiella variicola subsp. variicola]|nr:hypothetical protein [Klebsiella variicola subsp. variicola]